MAANFKISEKSLSENQRKIVGVTDSLQGLLLEKNRRYGDSALSPVNIFSKLDAGSSIKVRLDDKLSRVINGSELRKNDVADILGYLVLLCVSQDWTDFADLVD